jgi:hypothetical protein
MELSQDPTRGYAKSKELDELSQVLKKKVAAN